MGALASLDQREEVRKAVKALRGSAEIVFGDPDHVDVVDADAERGAFMSPVLLRAAAGRGRAARRRGVRPGQHRAAPTTPSTRRSTLAARGKGSLVGSVVTHDPDVARDVVLGARALARPDPGARPRRRRGVHRPRLAAADAGARRPRPRRRRRGARRHPRRAAPHAAHRGPGLARHAHRDHRPLDDRLAARATTDVHPFRKSLAELRDRRHDRRRAARRSRWTTSSTSPSSPATRSTRTPTRRPPRPNPLFGGIVAHGYLVVSLAAGLFVDPDPGPVLANFGVDNLRFLTPVKAGDAIAVTLTVKQITPRSERRLRRGALGRRRHQPGRRAGRDVRRADAGRQDLAAGAEPHAPDHDPVRRARRRRRRSTRTTATCTCRSPRSSRACGGSRSAGPGRWAAATRRTSSPSCGSTTPTR